MKLWSLLGNSQKLDGGAMFGNAPRAMWSQWMPPDGQNRVDLACRALLASPLAGKTVLFESGIGAFFEPKLRERYGVVEDRHVLLDSLAATGFTPEDIDVVVLSH
ncbi:MAG TPA: MBL fold metallo-hydrolase, partial [Lysobacter sp.]|nr:MBL fold metallo-hydrolase [Lysobacter sp.]